MQRRIGEVPRLADDVGADAAGADAASGQPQVSDNANGALSRLRRHRARLRRRLGARRGIRTAGLVADCGARDGGDSDRRQRSDLAGRPADRVRGRARRVHSAAGLAARRDPAGLGRAGHRDGGLRRRARLWPGDGRAATAGLAGLDRLSVGGRRTRSRPLAARRFLVGPARVQPGRYAVHRLRRPRRSAGGDLRGGAVRRTSRARAVDAAAAARAGQPGSLGLPESASVRVSAPRWLWSLPSASRCLGWRCHGRLAARPSRSRSFKATFRTPAPTSWGVPRMC